MMKFVVLLLVAAGAVTATLRAELSDEAKKALFLKNHASSVTGHSSSGTTQNKSHASTTPATHAKKHSTDAKHHSSSQSSHPAHPVSHTTAHAAVAADEKHSTQATHHTVASGQGQTMGRHSSPSVTHSQEATHTQPAIPVPSGTVAALPLPHGATPSAPITIEQSGLEADQGIEPDPTPVVPVSSGLFSWFFGSSPHKSYSYLRASTRAAIDHAPVRRGRWKYVIVHNSGTREGNARVFDIYHLRVRHMKNGLAYHFVIGDGHGSGDGQIEIGHRWTAQLNGGHVASDYLNDISLGICLVGDFNRDVPTKAQIGALEELIGYLRDRVGKTQGRKAIVYAHKEINPRPTDCPGDRFPYSWLHGKFR